jgi:competence protein ComEA
MERKKIIYFSFTALILIFTSISAILSENPDEIPVISNVSSSETVYNNFIQTSSSEYNSTNNTTTAFTGKSRNTVSVISETNSDVPFSNTSVTSENNTNETTIYEKTVQFPLNLNTASQEELMLIDGIGEVLSERIIQYRENNGSFYSMYQLTEINGIGEAKLEKLRSYLYIENETEYLVNDNHQEDYEINNENNEEGLIPQQNNSYSDNNSQQHEETSVPDTEYYEETETETTEIPMIELNSASAEDFMKLPGIDEEMAYKIVEFREKIWYFSHPYELLYIEGMSESLLSSIIDYLYIEGKEDIIY